MAGARGPEALPQTFSERTWFEMPIRNRRILQKDAVAVLHLPPLSHQAGGGSFPSFSPDFLPGPPAIPH